MLRKLMMETLDGEYQNCKAFGGAYTREHFFGKYPETAALVANFAGRGHLAPQPRRPRSAQGLCGVPRTRTTQGPAHRHPREDGEGLRHGHGRRVASTSRTSRRRWTTPRSRRFRDRFDIPVSRRKAGRRAVLSPGRGLARGAVPAGAPRRTRRLTAATSPQGRRVLTAPELGVRTPARRHRRPRNLHDDGVRAGAEHRAARQAGRPARRADRRRRSAHVRHGRPVPPDRHLRAVTARSTSRSTPTSSCTTAKTRRARCCRKASPKPARSPLDRRRDQLQHQQPADAAVLHLLLDVRHAARRRFRAAAGDMRARGFLLGATAGRTTLNGEGLQHEDGHSHLLAGAIPNCSRTTRPSITKSR